MDKVATRYGTRPSQIVGISRDIDAYDFDASIMFMSDRIRKKRGEDKKHGIQKFASPEEELEYLKNQFRALGLEG